MPVTVEWVNTEQTRLQYVVAGKWTLDELYPALKQGYTMLDDVPHDVDIVIDATDAVGVPANISAAASYAARNRRPNSRRLVVITQNTLIRATADLINRLSSKPRAKFEVVATLQDMENVLQGGTQA